MHSAISREEASRLRGLGVPVLMGTATALSAMRNLITWQQHRDAPHDAAPPAPGKAVLEEARAIVAAHTGGEALPLPQALRLLELFDIPSAASAFTSSEAETVTAAERLGFPIVLKTAAPEILHKTEAGGVAVGLGDRDAVAASYRRIAAACGPLVQVQAQAPAGAEVLLGMTNDPQFGPMVTVALGGIFTEILADAVTFLPPISAPTARDHLLRLKGQKLLQGYRGQPAADLNALTVVVERFSVLCASIGALFSAIDVNPVIAGPAGALAVDALFLPLHNP
jgi:acyl-CoA synthetase (NDP forming)